MRRTRKAAAAVAVGLLILLGQQALAGAESRPDSGATGTLLHDGFSGYPRLVRLAHSGAANGRILASVSGDVSPGHNAGLIFESTDDGKSFQKIADVRDVPETDGTGVCCGSLYELPRKVGSMPAGTLLRAATVGATAPAAERKVRQRVWRSDDHGRTWRHLSDMAVAPNHEGAWEPELSVTEDGRLAGYYSDESDKDEHSQKLVKVISSDGVEWSRPEDLIIHKRQSVRPGMAIVRKLPNGTYFMAYEVCNIDTTFQCSVYFRKSSDGWDWGDPTDPGTEVRTAKGRYALHTPNVAWSPGPGPDGTVLLVSEMLVEKDGSLAPGNAKTILTNQRLGKGPWHEMEAPVRVDGVNDSGCENFSPSLLPSTDGTKVLEMSTDLYAKNDCRSYFATGKVTLPETATARGGR